MIKIKAKQIKDLGPFLKHDINKIKPLYGLPSEVRYCKKCHMSNQKPDMCAEHDHNLSTNKETLIFNQDGICVACLYAEKKKDIDWDERESELKKLLSKYRSRNGSYDVVVPGSGGKDSFYVAHQLKYKYGMSPLTCTFAPNSYTDWGRHNFHSWLNEGFSNYLFTTNPLVHKFVTRLSLEILLHPFQPWILGQKYFPTKFSKLTKIPLVFYGENPAEYGNPNGKYYDDMQTEWHACKDKEKISIAGLDVKTLREDFGLKNNELEPYTPLSFDEFKDAEIKCVSWSYFENWHLQRNYYYTAENSNFKPSPERTLGTYSRYSSIDDKIDDLHFYTTKIKFGIGRAHHDVAQEIRSGDITTDEARSLINKYDGEYPTRFLDEMLDYLSIDKNDQRLSKFFDVPKIDKEYFDNLCDSFRSPTIWKKTNKGWELRKKLC